MESSTLRVLLISDDSEYGELLARLVSSEKEPSFLVKSVLTLRKAKEILSETTLDVVLIDLSLPDGAGIDGFYQIASSARSEAIVVLTNLDDKSLGLEAVLHGAQDYLVKGQIDEKLMGHVLQYAYSRKKAESELKEKEVRYQYILRVTNDAIWSWDFDKNLMEWNGGMRSLFGYAAHDVGTEAGWHHERIHPEDRSRVLNGIQRTIAEGTHVWTDEYRYRPNSGEYALVIDRGYIIYDEKGRAVRMIGAIQDVTEKRRSEEKIKQLAYFDSLTNLPNRFLLVDRLQQAIIAAHRYKQIVAVMSLDLDRFKRINDTLGHAVGDQLLKSISDRLTTLLYETDTVTRTGGDEFAILLPQMKKIQSAVKVAEKIFTAFRAPFFIKGYELFMSCSMGISFYPGDGQDPEILLKNADSAMYLAKEKGRNNYQLYLSAMNAKAFERLEMENSLQHALERNELRVHYQPFIDLKTHEITGMEALLRWEHPTRGLLQPFEFLPLAEETGLIVPIGEWVLRTACRQNKDWQNMGFWPLRVAVNLSYLQLRDVNLVQLIANTLEETGLDPSYLELELTENIITQNLEDQLMALGELKAMGVKFSIDDFGIGQSSLSALKRYPINTLKIDRSFVSEIPDNTDDAAIAIAIISMAHSLKLEVIAEGVETREQADFFQSMLCDKVQGFYFSKPVPASEFSGLLSAKRW